MRPILSDVMSFFEIVICLSRTRDPSGSYIWKIGCRSHCGMSATVGCQQERHYVNQRVSWFFELFVRVDSHQGNSSEKRRGGRRCGGGGGVGGARGGLELAESGYHQGIAKSICSMQGV